MVEEALVITYSLVSAVTTAEATGSLTTQSTMSSLIVWAPLAMIHMYWHSTDREAASTSETTFSTTSETANADSNSSPAEISSGAIAGIVVGCVIAGFVAIGIAAIFFIRRRRRRTTETLGKAGDADQAAKYHLHQQGQQSQYLTGPSEIDSRTELSELPGTRLIHEMDGDYNRRG